MLALCEVSNSTQKDEKSHCIYILNREHIDWLDSFRLASLKLPSGGLTRENIWAVGLFIGKHHQMKRVFQYSFEARSLD